VSYEHRGYDPSGSILNFMGYDGRYILEAAQVSSSGGQAEDQVLRSSKG
jgi:hypothetical protein